METRLSEDTLNDPVSRHMRRDFARLRTGQTVGEALAWLRQHPPEGRVIYFYVVDEEQRLQGVVPTRRLVLNPPDRPVAEVMVPKVIALPDDATVLDACEFFIQHRYLAFPVVDAGRRLVGQVDVELYTDELAALSHPSERDDLFQLIGVHVAQARQTSPVAAFRGRFPWLLCNLGGGILAAFLSGLYEDELSRVVALALFIPVVLALAESVAIQSVSLALQALHGGPPTWKELLPKLSRELGTGLLLGGASGLAVGLVALAWQGRVRVALCLLGGIGGGVTGAAVMGLAMPHLLRLLRRDPQVAAGPIALVAADMATLLLYFNLARWLLVRG
jgi:magnesium transporter